MTPLRALLLMCCITAAPRYAKPASPARETHAAAPAAIVFNDVEDTLTRANELDKPIVLYFTADWCGFCNVMEAESFSDAAVVRAARQFEWAKIDIDRNQPLAARFAVRGVPAFVFLNARGQMLDQATGYRTTRDFLQILESKTNDNKKARPVGPRLESVEAKLKELSQLNGGQWRTAVRGLLEQLAAPQDQQRDAAQQALLGTGERAYPLLLDAMGSDRLALRAAAYDLLVTGSQLTLAFDPFGPVEQRADQLAAWHKALQPPATQHSAGPSTDPPDR